MRRLSGSVIVAAIVITVLLAYWPGLTGGFLFDDYPNLVRDPSWKLTRLSPEELRSIFSGGIASAFGRPLALLSFALNHMMTGEAPYALKLTNVLLHALNAALVWRLLNLVLPLANSQPPFRHARFIAFAAALAWALHPLQTSTVLYVVQRMELGAATGVLLSLIAYIHARRLQLAGGRGLPLMVIAALSVALGVGFKETAFLAPLYAFMIEICVFRFQHKGGGRSPVWITTYAVSGVCAAVAFAWFATPLVIANANEARDFTVVERLWTQGPVLLTYLKQIVFPHPESLLFYYDSFPISHGLTDPISTLVAFAVLAGVGGIGILAHGRWPLVTLGIGWFFLGHSMSSNVVMLELAFEHRNYLPLLGIVIALIAPLTFLLQRLSADTRIALVCIPVVALGAITVTQAATWGDPMKLAWTLENRNVQSPRSTYALALQMLLSASGDSTSPMWSLAHGELKKSAMLPGNSPLPWQALIILDGKNDKVIEPETWQGFSRALTARPLTAEASESLYAVSQCRIQRNCKFDSDALFSTFIAVLEKNPTSSTAHTMYADFAWNVLGDSDLAIRMQRHALLLSQDEPSARIALARFLMASGQQEEARQLLENLERASESHSAPPASDLPINRAPVASPIVR